MALRFYTSRYISMYAHARRHAPCSRRRRPSGARRLAPGAWRHRRRAPYAPPAPGTKRPGPGDRRQAPCARLAWRRAAGAGHQARRRPPPGARRRAPQPPGARRRRAPNKRQTKNKKHPDCTVALPMPVAPLFCAESSRALSSSLPTSASQQMDKMEPATRRQSCTRAKAAYVL
jgi:hypothetical protein